MFAKVRNDAGETISEVLIASLVAVLGVLLFATMVSTSFHVINKSESTMTDFYDAENVIEEQSTALAEGVSISFKKRTNSVSGFAKEGDITNIKVSIYGEENGDVLSYAE